MTNVQMTVTNLLLPAGSPASGPSAAMNDRSSRAAEPGRARESGAPPEAVRGDHLGQTSSRREDPPAVDRREAEVRPAGGNTRREHTDPRSRPPAEKTEGPRSIRRRSTKPNSKTKAPASVAKEARSPFEAIVERLAGQVAQSTAPGGRKAEAAADAKQTVRAIKAAGPSLWEALAALKATAVKGPVGSETSRAKARRPAETASRSTAQAAAKVVAATPQAVEAAGEAAKAKAAAVSVAPGRSAGPTAPAPTAPTARMAPTAQMGPTAHTVPTARPAPTARLAPTAPTGAAQQTASHNTAAAMPGPAAGSEGTKAASLVPAGGPTANLPPDRAAVPGSDAAAGEGLMDAPGRLAAPAGPAGPAGGDVAAVLQETGMAPSGQEPATARRASPAAALPVITAAGVADGRPTGGRQVETFQLTEGFQGAEMFGPDPAASARAGGQGAAGPEDLPAHMPAADQIVETVRLRGARTGEAIVVRLNPPQLGRVRLTLQADGQEVRGVLEVDNPKTLAALQRETSVLADRLADGGVELRRLDVQLTQQGRGQMTDSASQQTADGGGRAPQREAPDEGNGNEAVPAAPGTSDVEPEDLAAQQVTGESINVWM